MGRISSTLNSFSTTSKIIFSILLTTAVISGAFIVKKYNDKFLIEIPASGGTITEGLIGIPRLINPILSESDTAKDIGAIVYSGLMKYDAQGELIPDIADSYVISPDNKTYTFFLKNNVYFHDGSILNADDVIFTIKSILNPEIHSPLKPYFDGVSVSRVDDLHLIFNLEKPIPNFLSDLTVGILPSHLWKDVDPNEFSLIEYNVQPIGSGPYLIETVSRDKRGSPTSYTLLPFNKYYGEKPHISSVNFEIYQNDDEIVSAWKSGDINSIGMIPPEKAYALKQAGARIEKHYLPRIFGLFLNQNSNTIFTDTTVRLALSMTAPRDQIIDSVFKGYALKTGSPFPKTIANFDGNISNVSLEENIAKANDLLDKAGWKLNADGVRTKKIGKDDKELSFNISTSDALDLKNTADILQSTWNKLGIKVSVNVFETGDLNQHIIRERRYDALLFGHVVLNDSDLFAFWHTSQRKDPGLNVAMYTSSRSDKILEDIKNSTSTDKTVLYTSFEKEFEQDMPAILLYSPVLPHLIPKDIRGYVSGPIRDISERFRGIESWYTDTDKVWPFFIKK